MEEDHFSYHHYYYSGSRKVMIYEFTLEVQGQLVVVNSTNAEDLQVIHMVKLLREVHLIEELYGNS